MSGAEHAALRSGPGPGPQPPARDGWWRRLWRRLWRTGPARAEPPVVTTAQSPAAAVVTAPPKAAPPAADAEPAPSPVERRLARIAKPQAAAAPSLDLDKEQLTWADVERLAADRSVESRALVAGRFGRRFGRAGTQAEEELSKAVLDLLVQDVATEVRRSLAEAVAASPDLPRSVALRLAGDEIVVARPLLERSPVLTDPDLIDVVRTSTMQHALAIAGRVTVSDTLSSALAATGDRAVVARLVGNAGATISHDTLEAVIAAHGSDESIRRGLVRRPDLSFELVEKLVNAVGDGLIEELSGDEEVDPARVRQLIESVRFQSTIGLVARGHRERRSLDSLRELFAAGRLRHDDLLRALQEGDVDTLEQGIGLHAGLDRAAVRRALYSPDRRRLAALCAKAGFTPLQYVTLRAAIQAAEEGVSSRASAESTLERTKWLEQQYLGLRRDPGAIEQLLA
jgi:uncharacterized protein (DUF2336 family)